MADSQSVVVSLYEEYTLTRKMLGESPWGLSVDLTPWGWGEAGWGLAGKSRVVLAGAGAPGANLGSGCRKAPMGVERRGARWYPCRREVGRKDPGPRTQESWVGSSPGRCQTHRVLPRP